MTIFAKFKILRILLKYNIFIRRSIRIFCFNSDFMHITSGIQWNRNNASDKFYIIFRRGLTTKQVLFV